MKTYEVGGDVRVLPIVLGGSAGLERDCMRERADRAKPESPMTTLKSTNQFSKLKINKLSPSMASKTALVRSVR
jgi:hypothetical protein